MKFLVKSKKEGLEIKSKILSIANDWPYVFLSDVICLFDIAPASESYEIGWPSEYLKYGKMQVRKHNNSWFLYIFGEPRKIEKKEPLRDLDVCIFESGLFLQLINEISKLRSSLNNDLADLMFSIDNNCYYRACIVKAKKSGRKEERQDREAKFHRWVDLSKGVMQTVALVEFDDGHVEQVQPDRIIFVKE